MNEGAKKLCKAAYEPRAGDYFKAAGKSWMTLTVCNPQYIWCHGWRDTQTMDVGEPIHVVEKLSLIRPG